MTFLLSFPKLPLVESQRREVELLVLRTIYLFLILEDLLGGGGPYSLVLFQNCPMFPCSLVPTRFHNLFSFLKFAYDVFFVLLFIKFCSPIPKNGLMFLVPFDILTMIPCSPKPLGDPHPYLFITSIILGCQGISAIIINFMADVKGKFLPFFPLVATLRRYTRSVSVRFKSFVILNQLFVKAPFARSCIVSSKGTLVNREDTSYETKMFPSQCSYQTKLFQFNRALYEQTNGVAMGSPLGPLLANVFMSYNHRRKP